MTSCIFLLVANFAALENHASIFQFAMIFCKEFLRQYTRSVLWFSCLVLLCVFIFWYFESLFLFSWKKNLFLFSHLGENRIFSLMFLEICRCRQRGQLFLDYGNPACISFQLLQLFKLEKKFNIRPCFVCLINCECSVWMMLFICCLLDLAMYSLLIFQVLPCHFFSPKLFRNYNEW